MTATATEPMPMVLAEVQVASVERLSPSFVRLELAAPELAEVGLADGSDGPWWDQRFKLIVPHADGALSSVADADTSWLGNWLEQPAAERGHMRTYTVREMRGSGERTRLVVDIVLHEGVSGPGSDWALTAEVGTRAVVLLPKRGIAFGGIEFLPPPDQRILLVGDETAVPAICAILEHLPADAQGAAFMEVPCASDVQEFRAPAGVEVTWLARGEQAHGAALTAAVTAHLGGAVAAVEIPDEVDPDLWETPHWSSSGEEINDDGSVRGDLYAWIAGEAGVVTGLRRHLVKERGMDRRQVAFMGYWRRGVSMKS